MAGGFRSFLAFWIGGASAPVEVPPDEGLMGGAGYPVIKRKFKKPKSIGQIVDAAFKSLFEDAIESPIPSVSQELKEIAQPFILEQKAEIPKVDWDALSNNLDAVTRILEVFAEYQRELDDEEALILLMT